MDSLSVGTISISIHSLHTEGDVIEFVNINDIQHFNPLPPHGGRLFSSIQNESSSLISIHSLHTEGDEIP